MGLIAKSATKKRVAPARGPINETLIGAPWTTTGAIPTGALVRSALFSIPLGGVTSTNSSRMGALTLKTTAHAWLESTDFRTWQIILGVSSLQKTITADWLVKLLLDVKEQTATVVTTQYRTLEGALLHPELHDAVRRELLRAISLGSQTDAEAEERVTSVSLQADQPFGKEPPGPSEVRFEISTTLEEHVLRERLRLLGHRVRETGADSIRWGLGLPADQDANEVTITLGDKVLQGYGRVAGASDLARRVATTDLRSFISRALFLVKSVDAEAAFQGPSEWAP